MIARPLAALVCATATLLTSACATSPGDRHPSYGQELDQLSADCRDRGGILVPIPNGGQTGRPQTDYSCNITGGASRLTRGN